MFGIYHWNDVAGQIKSNGMSLQRFGLQPTLSVSTEHCVESDFNAKHDKEQRAHRGVRHVHNEVAMVCITNAII